MISAEAAEIGWGAIPRPISYFPGVISANIAGIGLVSETAPTLFSPTKPDRGSLAMLARIKFEPSDKVLDLGCGYGLIAIYAAKVIGARTCMDGRQQ